MILVQKQEFFDWVLAQPDERKVDMGENYYKHECGCVMVQYGKDKFDIPFRGCGYNEWCGGKDLEENVFARFDGFNFRDIFGYRLRQDRMTFGELKKYIQTQ